ncbi:TPA: DUF551 domain-containing protein [Klebsiella pneumoniae]|uniref:DUF551 domain-containing protein n=1 Tax=Klebsiella pneumoniae TaxID=573 RepID=UPI0015E7816E|nr:DUF551 domain-containing protein [Klebsiella pneumoniae]MBA1572588.1 DUF551 domain-containing protein [Klebsiella pneumoniae]MBF7831213.1 DUF551 domain-containing protein [Klebsiella pneumoniae]MBK4912454.1 DUF551 domain-containing protein [Klebsiella pneumoniae]HCA6909032.1 DUF551 domain-containing protein [Klebsiella pneumoniae]HCF8700565.1 DUF551 domain-containing protein [Klebsiella pneumoniae]
MTSKLTRERLEKIKSWRETYGAGSNVMLPAEEAEELARMALSAMDSEPVAYIFKHPAGRLFWSLTDESNKGHDDVMPVYASPQPAPEYPETLPCPVLLEPGMRFGKGVKTSTMLAALARRAVHESDMAALSPEERAEFQARIEDFKALIAQPVPAVPEEITIETATIIAYGLPTTNIGAIFKAGHDACRAAMLAATPQSPGSEPSTVPGKWIPVSERIPDNTEPVLCIEKRADFGTYGQPFVCWHDGGGWVGKTNYRPIVTHWMQLPAGPKEDIKALIPLVSRNEQERK